MGLIMPNSFKCDKSPFNHLVDDSTWFSASLIDFEALSKCTYDDYCKLSMNKKFNTHSKRKRKKLLSRIKKCFGRICVEENCIIFQGFNCFDLIQSISVNKDECPATRLSCPSPENDHRISEASNYFMRPQSAQVASSGKLHTFMWPLSTIRHFGHYGQVFTFDTGRLAPTGEGRLIFKIKNLPAFLETFHRQYSASVGHLEQDSICGPTGVSPPQPAPMDYFNLTRSHSYRNLPTQDPATSSSAVTPCYCHTVWSMPRSHRFSHSTTDVPQLSSLSPSADSCVVRAPVVSYAAVDFSGDYPSGGTDCRRLVTPEEQDPPLNYLTISQRQTQAAEKVINRIK